MWYYILHNFPSHKKKELSIFLLQNFIFVIILNPKNLDKIVVL